MEEEEEGAVLSDTDQKMMTMTGSGTEEEEEEEEEADKSSAAAYGVFEESRTAMEEIVAKMLFIKKESSSSSSRGKSDLKEFITHISLLLINLRQVNRSILLEEDRVKLETESAKVPVDFTMLQLHNLMYEKNHYMKAIKACKDFKSRHPDIELVPEEVFYRCAPEDIKKNILASDDAHDLMLKRLNFELYQRKELCKLHEELEQRKRSLQETIANRKKSLSALPSLLKSLKKASSPVQQHLGIQHTKKLKQHQSAELLPPPLYIIYSQFQAQKEAFGENIDLEILGSVKDAQAFAQQQANKDTGISANTENNRLEDDAPEEEEDGQRRRKRQKKVPSKDNLDHIGIYQSHPLNIVLHIYNDEVSDAKPSKLVTLRFEYLLKLNVVCVGIDGSQGQESDLLCNLFPNDTGTELPHQTAKLFAGNSIEFDEKRALRPFKWAQHLAGIDFLPDLSPLLTDSTVSSNETQRNAAVLSGLSLYRQQHRVPTVLQRIRSRKIAQVALMEQLDLLAKLKWPPLAFGSIPWALHTPVCTLQSFVTVGHASKQVSSFSAGGEEQAPGALDLDVDGKSGTMREDMESTREDGELPSAVQALTAPNYLKLTLSKGSNLEHSSHLNLISKSIMLSNKTKSQISKKFGEHEDLSELMMESGGEEEEPIIYGMETENSASGECCEMVDRSWEDCGVREFFLVLSRETDRVGRNVNLEAKIKISMEYPLRPPLFTLSLSTVMPRGDHAPDVSEGNKSASCEDFGFKWYNELRAMEAEINLHILKLLPRDYENDILAHQVCCLAMLFDFQMDQSSSSSAPEIRKGNCVIDVGLGEPVNGRILTRSFRGRDRRKMLSWKDGECVPGYPT